MKVLLCCIGKLENKYIKEFIDYYKNLGVDKVVLYDNNDEGGEDFRDAIGDYINSMYVILENVRNQSQPQMKAYTHCYRKYSPDYDWIMFFDIDEFLILKKHKDIHEYLSDPMFEDYQMIHVNWEMYGDGGHLTDDGRPMIERFTVPVDPNCPTIWGMPENNHIKSIIRKGIPNLKFEESSHTPYINGNVCNSSGEKINEIHPLSPWVGEYAVLKHFCTKSTQEYAEKLKRGFSDYERKNYNELLELYFKRNEITQEKIDLFKKELGIDMSYLLDLEKGKKRVFMNFLGRLGNEFFCLVSGKYYADKNNADILFTPNFHADAAYINDMRRKVFKDYKFIGREWLAILSGKQKIMAANERNSISYSYVPDIKEDEDGMFIGGYRQSPKYWNNDKEYALNLVRPSKELVEYTKNLYKEVDFNNIVSLNVRQFDNYEDEKQDMFNSYLGFVDVKYYWNCIDRFPSNQKFLVTSNDMEMAKQEFTDDRFIFADKEVPNEPFGKTLVDYCLQTLCADGNIMSNSTFSWWGAYANESDKRLVIYPFPFFKEFADYRDYIPEDGHWFEEPTIWYGEKSQEEKRKDIQIFSLCYEKKNFEFLDDAVITPLQVGAANGKPVCTLKDNTGDNISSLNSFFIENTGTYWIWKNVNNPKYKGQMQYRRPLSGVCENMEFDLIFNTYDVITCEPFHHPDHKIPTKEEPMVIPADTVEEGYAFSNCKDDLLILEMVVKMYYPEYADDWDKYIKHGPDLYYSNGFIMRTEDFNRYCEFLFGCLNGYLNMADIHNEKQLYDHVQYNLETGKYIRYRDKSEITQGAIKWQTEIGGFLSERIWTLWLQHNFPQYRILKLPYIKMEEGMYT